MNPLLKKAYWALAGMGALYFVSLGFLMNPWVQNKYVYLSRTLSEMLLMILISFQCVIYAQAANYMAERLDQA